MLQICLSQFLRHHICQFLMRHINRITETATCQICEGNERPSPCFCLIIHQHSLGCSRCFFLSFKLKTRTYFFFRSNKARFSRRKIATEVKRWQTLHLIVAANGQQLRLNGSNLRRMFSLTWWNEVMMNVLTYEHKIRVSSTYLD